MIDETLFVPQEQPIKDPFKYGTVIATSGYSATVKFDGEDTASNKYYKSMQSYTPAANDRVILAWHSGTGLILGKF